MLKKYLFYYIIFCLLIICFLIIPSNKPIFADAVNKYENVKYTFYTAEICNGSNYVFNNCEIINVGYGSIITTDLNNASNVKKNVNNLQGESCELNNATKEDCFEMLNHFNATIVRQENLDDISIIYAYSPLLEKFVFDDGDKINLQFALVSETLTVGYPLIMGSY